MRLARCFGTTAEFWLYLKSADDLSKVGAERGKEIARSVKRPERTPLRSSNAILAALIGRNVSLTPSARRSRDKYGS